MAKTLLKPPPFIKKIEIVPPVVHGVKLFKNDEKKYFISHFPGSTVCERCGTVLYVLIIPIGLGYYVS